MRCPIAACRCTHTPPCDHGWISLPPREAATVASPLSPDRLPLKQQRDGKWLDAKGDAVKTQQSGEIAQYDRVERCPTCAAFLPEREF